VRTRGRLCCFPLEPGSLFPQLKFVVSLAKLQLVIETRVVSSTSSKRDFPKMIPWFIPWNITPSVSCLPCHEQEEILGRVKVRHSTPRPPYQLFIMVEVASYSGAVLPSVELAE